MDTTSVRVSRGGVFIQRNLRCSVTAVELRRGHVFVSTNSKGPREPKNTFSSLADIGLLLFCHLSESNDNLFLNVLKSEASKTTTPLGMCWFVNHWHVHDIQLQWNTSEHTTYRKLSLSLADIWMNTLLNVIVRRRSVSIFEFSSWTNIVAHSCESFE